METMPVTTAATAATSDDRGGSDDRGVGDGAGTSRRPTTDVPHTIVLKQCCRNHRFACKSYTERLCHGTSDVPACCTTAARLKSQSDMASDSSLAPETFAAAVAASNASSSI
eukprot:350803-Chlamydomonas_euryale.AAC.4